MITKGRLFPGITTVAASVLWGALCAGLLTYVGSADFENYDHSFFSLNRGTRMEMVTLAGQPVYTLALGLGVRLPLHGNLSASPAAAVSSYLPEPLTYWLLFTFAIGSSTLLLHLAAGMFRERLLSWCTAFLIFWSLPVTTYSLNSDWPETAVSYWATIAVVLAPHALLSVLGAANSIGRRVAAAAGVLGLCWGLIATAHPGFWPIIGASLALSALLALVRTDQPLRVRLVCVALLGACSATVVALLAPDVLREARILGDQSATMARTVRGPEGTLWAANVGQLFYGESRRPFTFLLLSLASVMAAFHDSNRVRRRVVMGTAGLSLVFGLAASTTWPALPASYTPSAIWAFRDPAIACAAFSACGAAAALLTSTPRTRLSYLFALVLFMTAAQGPVVATLDAMRQRTLASMVHPTMAPRGLSVPSSRIAQRGLTPDRVALGSRIAFWPGVTGQIRNGRQGQAEYVDAGYVLVTATTKQRTMRNVIFGNNNVLFEQGTNLPPEALCAPAAVRLLQLQYLIGPPGITCDAWQVMASTRVYESLDVYRSTVGDTRIQAIPSVALTEQLRRTAIFGSDSELLSLLQPQDGTSMSAGAGSVVVRWTSPAATEGLTYLLPIAYDSAWRASDGQVMSVGGLLALVDVSQPSVSLSFVPDLASRLRVAGVVLAQIFTILGLMGIAVAAPVAPSWELARLIGKTSRRFLTWVQRGILGPLVRWLAPLVRHLDSLYASYCIVVVATLIASQDPGVETRFAAALLFPATALVITRMTPVGSMHEWLGRIALAGALVAVAARGSIAAEAQHDPLFWAILASVALMVSWAPARYRRLTLASAATAGAMAAVAVLLTLFPQLWSSVSALPASIPDSTRLFVSYLGIPAAVLLLALWLRALGMSRAAWRTVSPVTLMARTALLAWLLACSAGATFSNLDIRWFIALGVLVGLATPTRQNRSLA